MTQSDFEQRIKANAYKLFFGELQNHISKAGQILAPERQPSDSELKQVGASFHTVRGGAGFFGLNEIAEISGRIEDLLLNAEAHLKVEAARGLLSQVTAMTGKLPKP